MKFNPFQASLMAGRYCHVFSVMCLEKGGEDRVSLVSDDGNKYLVWGGEGRMWHL